MNMIQKALELSDEVFDLKTQLTHYKEALEFSSPIIDKALCCASDSALTFIPLEQELTHAKRLNDKALSALDSEDTKE